VGGGGGGGFGNGGGGGGGGVIYNASYTITAAATITVGAGGAALTNLGVTATQTGDDSGVGFCTFSTLTFGPITMTARGALIYNSTPSALSNTGAVLTNAAVCVLDFGGDKVAVNSPFTITFPPAAFNAAIIRIT
jgi:hypothetical protein